MFSTSHFRMEQHYLFNISTPLYKCQAYYLFIFLFIFCGKWIFKLRHFIQIFKRFVISCYIIKNCALLWDIFIAQSMAIIFHLRQHCSFGTAVGMLGFLPSFLRCLPFSISKEWELVRILVIAFLYLKFVTESIYFSMPKVVLIFA